MIEFTDRTIIESEGSYSRVKEIMDAESAGEWMLLSRVLIYGEEMVTHYELQFWNDGRVVIIETNRPMSVQIPGIARSDEDLASLKDWCETNGWHIPSPHPRLLDRPDVFQFWKHMYLTGLVESEILKAHDDAEIARMSRIVTEKQDASTERR